MRIIKFRAWDKKGKRMINEQSFGPQTYVVMGLDCIPTLFNKTKEVFEEPPREFVLMQFTGLKDKNGKEIYEGDILKHPRGQILICEWIKNDANYIVFGGKIKLQLSKLFSDILEVIGNIWENPGLLKEKLE